MTKEELYKVTDVLNEVLGNFLRGSEAEEVIAKFEEAVEKSELLKEESVSDELEKEIQEYYDSRREYGGKYNAVIPVYRHQLADIASHFTNWQKQKMMKDAVEATVTDIRTYKDENEVDFSVMYEKGIIPYELEQEVKLIVLKED